MFVLIGWLLRGCESNVQQQVTPSTIAIKPTKIGEKLDTVAIMKYIHKDSTVINLINQDSFLINYVYICDSVLEDYNIERSYLDSIEDKECKVKIYSIVQYNSLEDYKVEITNNREQFKPSYYIGGTVGIGLKKELQVNAVMTYDIKNIQFIGQLGTSGLSAGLIFKLK